MIFEWNELHELRERGYLRIVPQPDGPLTLLTYTKTAQYEPGIWDAEPTLLHCRGTVIDSDGRPVLRGMKKFFNLCERPETGLDALVSLGLPEVAHKLDGSLILAAIHGRETLVTSRGSWTSPQAIAARKILADQCPVFWAAADPALTYCFELIGPENRIVVHYPDDALILTAVVDTRTGYEYGREPFEQAGRDIGMPTVLGRPPDDWVTLAALTMPNFEGFVLHWPTAQRRVKVKLAEYVRLHRLITGLSEKTLWTYLRSNRDLASLRREVPEESLPWFDGAAKRLTTHFLARATAVEEALVKINRVMKKAAATIVLAEYPLLKKEIFLAIDGGEYRDLIWKTLEPSGVPHFAEDDAETADG